MEHTHQGNTQNIDKHEPTAPPWDDEAELAVPLQGSKNAQYTHPIQCVITPSLAMVGAVFIVMTTSMALTLCWLARKGYTLQGFG